MSVCLLAALILWSELGRRRNVFDRTYRIAAEHSPPYTLLAPDGSVTGLAVDILSEAAQRRGIHLKWVPVHTTIDESMTLRRGGYVACRHYYSGAPSPL